MQLIYHDCYTRIIATEAGVALLSTFERPTSWHAWQAQEHPTFVLPDLVLWCASNCHWNKETREALMRSEFGMLHNVNLFIRQRDGETLQFAGEASLRGIGDVSRSSTAVYFQLRSKIPKVLWGELGGYMSWLVRVGSTETEVNTWQQAVEFLHAHFDRPALDIEITRFEGDTLHVAMNDQDEAVASYARDAASPEVY